MLKMSVKEPLNIGGSLKVPNVQELAKEVLPGLPPRYARPRQEPAAPVNTFSEQIPVIDMEKLLSDEFKETELLRFHVACRDWGFFQMVNHGVSESLLDKVKMEIQNFFKLPMEEKKKFEQLPGDMEGYGQSFVVSEEQKLDWADMFYFVALPVSMRKPHLLPKFPPSLRETLEEYTSEMKWLFMEIMDLISKTLNMDIKDLRDLFEEGMQSIRLNYYPPCPQPELAMGLTPHSDQVGLTILLEVNDKEGLEIRKDGKWFPVKSMSNAFVVNIGDIVEILTNGAYRSIEHRAVVNSQKERLSVATFLMPRIDGVIAPAPSIVTPETPAKFKEITQLDFLKNVLGKKLDGKLHLNHLRVQDNIDK